MDNGLSTCEDKIYSDKYVDYIIDYNKNTQYELRLYEMDCIQEVNDRLVVAYAPRYASDFIMGKVGYRALPKCYGLQDTSALQETGILRLRRQPFFNLYGQGVLVGIIDAGIDFRHPAFVWTNNTSKILCAWNQEDKTGTAPNGISYGSEYSQEDFNHALNNEDSYKFVDRIIDENGHGTIMASVAAGREIEEEDFSGAAPLSDLVIVKLKRAKEVYYDYYRISNDCDAYQENDIMMALRYLLDISNQLQRPMVICLGLGTNQGDHNGTGPLAEYLNSLGTIPGIYVCVSAGNETGRAHHFRGNTLIQNEYQDVEIYVGEESSSSVNGGFSLELWGDAPTVFAVQIKPPIGEFTSLIEARFDEKRTFNFLFTNTKVEVVSEIVERSTGDELMFFRFINPASGIWVIRVFQQSATPGRFDMWLPIEKFLTIKTTFLEPDPNVTICEPGNVDNIITFAACTTDGRSLYVNSSRGYTRYGRVKPDLTAPGVDVYSALGVNEVQQFGGATGTSVASALGAGTLALFAEWSLGNAATSTVTAKKYLIRGADQSNLVVPDKSWGWGRVNLYSTFVSVGE